MLHQLSYEATEVGSRSIVGSYVPVKEMSVDDIWNKSYMNCGNEMKMKKWSSQWTQFMQLRKVQDFNGVWARDPAITWAMLYQLSYEATDVGSRSIVGSYVPVKEMSVNDIYELRKWNENEEMIIAVNAIYAIA